MFTDLFPVKIENGISIPKIEAFDIIIIIFWGGWGGGGGDGSLEGSHCQADSLNT